VAAPGEGRTPPRNQSPWAFVSLGLEFAVTVGLFAWGGWWVDQHWGLHPWCTVAGPLMGVTLAVYRLIRETAQ
jgi:hypothetical protein